MVAAEADIDALASLARTRFRAGPAPGRGLQQGEPPCLVLTRPTFITLDERSPATQALAVTGGVTTVDEVVARLHATRERDDTPPGEYIVGWGW